MNIDALVKNNVLLLKPATNQIRLFYTTLPSRHNLMRNRWSFRRLKMRGGYVRQLFILNGGLFGNLRHGNCIELAPLVMETILLAGLDRFFVPGLSTASLCFSFLFRAQRFGNTNNSEKVSRRAFVFKSFEVLNHRYFLYKSPDVWLESIRIVAARLVLQGATQIIVIQYETTASET